MQRLGLDKHCEKRVTTLDEKCYNCDRTPMVGHDQPVQDLVSMPSEGSRVSRSDGSSERAPLAELCLNTVPWLLIPDEQLSSDQD